MTIYCQRAEDVLPYLGRFDLLIADPAYGISADKAKAHSSIRDNPKWPVSRWDEKPTDQALVDQCVSMAEKAVVWGGNYFKMPASPCWLAWIKPEAESGFSMADMELAWTNLPNAARCKTLPRRDGNEHPTQKPLALMSWCIQLAGKDCQTILDPFAGSCTTGRAAKDLGRKCVCIEREERYCEIGARRMQQEVMSFDVPSPVIHHQPDLSI